MSVQLPSYIIESEEIAYANQLVTAHLGRNTRTGLPVVVLRGASAVMPRLQMAKKVLDKVSSAPLSPEGLPTVHELFEGQEETALLLDDLYGVPAYRRLHKIESYSEDELLLVAEKHTAILQALHNAGFSGLRPTTREVWIDGTMPAITLFGWEWVNQHTEDASGDIRHAAALWIELGTGLAPTPYLDPAGGNANWRSLSLGTRQFLLRLLRGPRLESTDELGKLISQRRREVAFNENELLQLCQSQMESIGEESPPISRGNAETVAQTTMLGIHLVALLDMGMFKFPHQIKFSQLSAALEIRMKDRPDAMIAQAKHLIRLGEYTEANNLFERMYGHIHSLSPDKALAMARWRTTAQILVAVGDHKMPRDRWVSPVCEAVELAGIGKFSDALKSLDPLASELSDGLHIPPLSALRGEIELQIEWQAAEYAYHKGKYEQAEYKYQEIAAKEVHISYWVEVVRVWGTLPVQRAEEMGNLYRNEKQSKQSKRKAINYFAKERYELAIQHARAAAHFSRNDPELLRECVDIEHMAHLRVGMKTPQGGQPFSDLSWNEVAALAAKTADYLRLYPTDEWAKQVSDQLRDPLLITKDRQSEDQRELLLYRYWSNEKVVREYLSKRAEELFEGWKETILEHKTALIGINPNRAQKHYEKLLNHRNQLQHHRVWLKNHIKHEEINQMLKLLVECQKKVTEILDHQKRLRHGLETAHQNGIRGDVFLDEAAMNQIELFDESSLSISLLRSINLSQPSPKVSNHNALLNVAIAAWKANHLDLARQLFESITANSMPGSVEKVGASVAIELLDEKIDISTEEHRELTRFSQVNLSVDNLELEPFEKELKASLVMLSPTDRVRIACAKILQLLSQDKWQVANSTLHNTKGADVTLLTMIQQHCINQCEEYIVAFLDKKRNDIVDMVAQYSLDGKPLTGLNTKEKIQNQIELLYALNRLAPGFSQNEQKKVKEGLLKNLDNPQS